MLVIAHRGASADAPENTLPAFELALRARADLVELDYRHARDGVPVVVHDETLDRTTDAVARWGGAGLRVDARPAGALSRLDAGGWFHPRFRGARIPTLATALDAIRGPAVALIERKAGDAETLVALLEARADLERVVVQSFDWTFLATVRAHVPQLVLGALGEGPLRPAHLERAAHLGARIVGWHHEAIRADDPAAAHAQGLRLWAYTVNDVPRARALHTCGVDGVITDRPEAIRAGLSA